MQKREEINQLCPPQRLPLIRFLPVLITLLSGCGGLPFSAIFIARPTVVSAPVPSTPTHVVRYTAFGDSITYGFGLNTVTESYPYLIGASKQISVLDAGRNGDQACDLFPRQIHPTSSGYFTSGTPLYTVVIGTNDVTFKGKGAYEDNYSACLRAAITFLQLSRSDKVLAGDAQLTLAGSCAATGEGAWFNAAVCPLGGDISVQQFTTFANPIYAWYIVDDNAAAEATLTINVDGRSTTWLARPLTPISTRNLIRRSVALARIPAVAGAHSIEAHATAGVALLGFGTYKAESGDSPVLALGDIPRARNDIDLRSGDFAAYRMALYSAIAQLQNDGLPLRFASTTEFLSGAGSEYVDGLHPSALGQVKLSNSFSAVLGDIVR